MLRRLTLLLPLIFIMLVSVIVTVTRNASRSEDEPGLLFLDTRDNGWYWMRTDGSDLVRLVDFNNIRPPDSSRVLTGVLSPNNHLLAATSGFLDSVTMRYWLVDRETHGIRSLIYPESGDKDFVWSPDSRYIAYIFDRTLYVVDTEDGALYVVAHLTAIPGALYFNSFTWSPDSTQIAFDVALGVDQFALYIIERDGSGLRLLRESYAATPVWDTYSNHLYYMCGTAPSQFCAIDMDRGIHVQLASLVDRVTRVLLVRDAAHDRLILQSANSFYIYEVLSDNLQFVTQEDEYAIGVLRWFDDPDNP